MINLPLTDVKFNGLGVTESEGQAEFCAALEAKIKFAHHKTHWLYYEPGKKATIINTKTGNRKEISILSCDWTGELMRHIGVV